MGLVKPIKIGLNLVGFIPGGMGGSETYCRNLINNLQKTDTTNSYVVLCDDRYAQEFQLSNNAFTIESCNYTQPSFKWFVRGVVRNTIKIDMLRPVFNRLKVDLIHHPCSILNPLRTKIPSVLTFLDMQHEFFPEFFSPLELKIRKEFYRPSAEQATRIIAISEHVKSSLVGKYGINPDKIDVIYLGHDPCYRIYDKIDRLEGIKNKYGLHKPFMYYPAATWPHKNHKKLLAALSVMKERYRFDGQLVLTGTAMRANNEILDEISRLGLEGTVKILGYLPYEELPYLYNLARMLVFPSLFEGFGLPLVEAMACGCPIACSFVTSIPEVVGDVAVTFDPASIEDIAEKAWALWNDDTLRQDLKLRGLKRTKLFNWDNTVRETLAVYEKVAGKR